MSRSTQAQVTGIDARGPSRKLEPPLNGRQKLALAFEQADANERLSFQDASVDEVFSNEAMCLIFRFVCAARKRKAMAT